MSDRCTLDKAHVILKNELAVEATCKRANGMLTVTAIEPHDRGYVERQVDYWLGGYEGIGELRIAYFDGCVEIEELA